VDDSDVEGVLDALALDRGALDVVEGADGVLERVALGLRDGGIGGFSKQQRNWGCIQASCSSGVVNCGERAPGKHPVGGKG
jgi:hypothetical protein